MAEGERSMERFVVSAPRSGLNWFRFWIEDGYGLRTAEHGAVVGKPVHGAPCFRRSHDPLRMKPTRFWRAGRNRPAWEVIDPAETAGGKVVLILRHPLEICVRAARGSLRRFRVYESCIRFWSEAAGEKYVAYYEDLTARPEAMAELLAFFDLTPAPGHEAPDLEAIRAGWVSAAARSRANYNARHSQGAKTAARPLDFLFHQRRLSARAAGKVWQHLESVLRPEELALLARYRAPGAGD